MTEQLRGHYEVGVAAHERGRERMPEHVRGHMLLKPSGGRDPGDHVVHAAGAQPAAAAVHKQRAVVAARPALAVLKPVLERLAQRAM